jgi:hypothetical protein
MSISQNYPTIEPSLNLSFALTKKLDPRVTFSRPTTGVAYDGKTVAKAEENLLLRSQEFDNAAWTKVSSTVTANSTTAPDGTTTAETLTATAATSAHVVISSAISCPNGAGLSVFAKQGTAFIMQLYVGGNITPYANFDLSAGTAHGFGAGTTASIVNAGDGWYRCQLVSTVTAVTSLQIAIVTSTSSARSESWTALGTETLFLWGAQAENRQFVTAYTLTTTQPITNYIPVLQTASANVARFDHNPVTGESLGLLVEEQRTNLLLRSEEFDNAAWTKTRSSITSNTIVAPDGTLTGDKLVESTDNGTHSVSQLCSITSGVSYTSSWFVKKGERTKVQLRRNGTVFEIPPDLIFDLDVGTVTGSLVSGWTNPFITPLGNDWFRLGITATANATGTGGITLLLLNDSGSNSYTGDGYSGIYIWGAQLESSFFSTSYIKTVASQVTRSADSASMTGANFSEWFSQGAGTFYCEWQTGQLKSGAGGDVGPFNVNAGGTNILNQNWLNGNVGSSGLSNLATNINANQFIKVANSFDGNASVRQGSANGNTVITSTAAVNLSSADRITFGRYFNAGSATLNNHIKKISFYSKALTATELQALTS